MEPINQSYTNDQVVYYNTNTAQRY